MEIKRMRFEIIKYIFFSHYSLTSHEKSRSEKYKTFLKKKIMIFFLNKRYCRKLAITTSVNIIIIPYLYNRPSRS